MEVLHTGSNRCYDVHSVSWLHAADSRSYYYGSWRTKDPWRSGGSPSAEQGLPLDTEEQLRTRGCELIQAAGILLRMPQVAMATGQILFQRFFYCKSFIRHCVETVAMACVHLASKIEEEPRRVRDVLNVFHRLKHSKGSRTFLPLPLDANYISMKSQVIKAERRVLKELGFCVHVKHPHKIIVMYLQVLECEKNAKLVQMAWNYMNDSLRTDVFLRFSAETVACACIYLSARSLQIPLPDQPPWFWLFGATEEDLREICHRILRLYTLPHVSLSKLQLLVAECRHVLDSSRGKPILGGALLSINGTPTLDAPTSFSPTSASPTSIQATRESPLSQLALKKACRKLTNGDGKTRLSRSDERREADPESPAHSLRRRCEGVNMERSRSLSSPTRSLSPIHRGKQPPTGRERDREKERERERRREREREREREKGRKEKYAAHRR
ncbi:hypothetical protein SKAU_G00172390 [Synaphobranchus kaupii]|uniref:Cyclin-L2 n=1 Tax=Synaphobranchus kaupii TaxID=118154 RepID=A0A9Q1FL64_SYNKA|nr:hypothetical protein SKAU_G00172390 [Synaphobranchus kaupii]